MKFSNQGETYKNIIDLMRRFIAECILKHKNIAVEIILMLTSMLRMNMAKKKLWRKFRKKPENEKLNSTSKHQKHH